MQRIDGPVMLTSISLFETLIGEPRLEALIPNFTILPYDTESAQVSANMHTSLPKREKLADLLIASICKHHDGTLVTCDKEFPKVPGIKIITIT